MENNGNRAVKPLTLCRPCAEKLEQAYELTRIVTGSEKATCDECGRRSYDAFEKVYKECITEPFKCADAVLKEKVTEVEDSIKGECEARMQEYFSELCAAEQVEWLKFEQAGLKIDLATARQKSHAKLREQIAGFVVGVAQAVNTISKMEDAEEIMAEYGRPSGGPGDALWRSRWAGRMGDRVGRLLPN